MRRFSLLALAFLLTATTLLQSASAADGPPPRQKYSTWSKSTKLGYFYCTYNYLPTKDSTEYLQHYVIWDPKRPEYCYCYNPYKKTFYGRWDSGACGKDGCHLTDKTPVGYYSIASAQQSGSLKS
ncbi:MAG: hypothetical protein KDA79_07360, partial [Planctomycetaceae bacterium]|nr:hypothetical protein [Planctomycetaceae bacterium]